VTPAIEAEVSENETTVKVTTAAKARKRFALRFPNPRPARFIASVVLGASLVFCVLRIIPEYQEWFWRNQQENLRKAGLFIFARDYEIRSDPRFQQIHLVKSTARGGSVFVFGKVVSETDEVIQNMLSQK